MNLEVAASCPYLMRLHVDGAVGVCMKRFHVDGNDVVLPLCGTVVSAGDCPRGRSVAALLEE